MIAPGQKDDRAPIIRETQQSIHHAHQPQPALDSTSSHPKTSENSIGSTGSDPADVKIPASDHSNKLQHAYPDASTTDAIDAIDATSTPNDPTSNTTRRNSTTEHASCTTQLAHLKKRLHANLRQFRDFPAPGILFEDIIPIFKNPSLHRDLIEALYLHARLSLTSIASFSHTINPGNGRSDQSNPSNANQSNQSRQVDADSGIDIVIGLEARGFLFGPTLALRLNAGFVPVRKKGKLPGPTQSATYEKEYGTDVFEIQEDAIQPGQRVLIVDDIIATGLGGTAAAAGRLVKQLHGDLVGYVFILELDFLKGREKLAPEPVYTLLKSQET